MSGALDPARLRAHYAAFTKPGRVLLTGHSHQAWPDAAREGMIEAFDDAAAHVDDKWERAFAAADAVRDEVAARVGARADEIALGASTHDLLLRMLSAFDLAGRPHLVTTRGEFHSITRQLERLDEDRVIRVTWVDPHPVSTLAERLGAEIGPKTAAVLVSTVLFETSSVVPGIRGLVGRARGFGAEVLLDAYHAFYAVPFDLAALGAEDAFLVGGGYKYAQWGEGVCFLRVPPREAGWRPVITGWFAGFADLASRTPGRVHYARAGKDAFAGATYDPVSHYRARAVVRFMKEQGMTAAALRALSLRQTRRITDGLAGARGLEVVTPAADAERGGFVAARVADAGRVVAALREQGIFVDARGSFVRLGPAPYVLDDEIDRAVSALRAIVAT